MSLEILAIIAPVFICAALGVVWARTGLLAPLLETSAAVQALMHTTADHREAVQAFSERRAPKFTGK